MLLLDEHLNPLLHNIKERKKKYYKHFDNKSDLMHTEDTSAGIKLDLLLDFLQINDNFDWQNFVRIL